MRPILLLTVCLGFAIPLWGGTPDWPVVLERPAVLPPVSLSAEDATRRESLTRYGLGLLRARHERLASAAKEFQTAADREPLAAAPQRELVRIYADLGRDPAAIRAAKKVLELDPHDASTARTLGKLLFDAKQFAAAGVAFRQAADSPRWRDQPSARFSALRDAARAFRSASDSPAVEAACRDALAVIRSNREALAKSQGFTDRELDRYRGELYEWLGDSLLQARQWDSAKAAFATARTLFADPKGANLPTAAARVHWNLARTAIAQADWPVALKEVESFLAYKPETLDPYLRYAEVLRQLRREREIVPRLTDQVTRQPKNTGIAWIIAAEVARVNFPAADKAFQELVRTGSDPATFAVLVSAYAQVAKPKELLDLLEAVFEAAKPKDAKPLEVKPDDDPEKADPAPGAAAPALALNRARLLSSAVQANTEVAPLLIKQLAAELQANRIRTSETLELVSALATRAGQTDELLDGLRLAVRGRSTPEVYNLLFYLLRQQRAWDEIIALARKARNTEEFRNKLTPYYSEAEAQAELGDAVKALAAIDYVVNNVVADGKLSGRLERARILNVLGRPKQAIEECEDIRAEFRTPAAERRIRIVLADSHNGLKEYAKSEALLRGLLDDDPDDVLVLNNLGYNLADQGRKLEEAEQLIRRAIELDEFARVQKGSAEPSSGVYLDSLGWALFRRGKWKEAQQALEKAIALPDAVGDPVVWDHLGDVRFRLQDSQGARKAWQKAQELLRGSHQGRQGKRLEEVKKKIALVD